VATVKRYLNEELQYLIQRMEGHMATESFPTEKDRVIESQEKYIQQLLCEVRELRNINEEAGHDLQELHEKLEPLEEERDRLKETALTYKDAHEKIVETARKQKEQLQAHDMACDCCKHMCETCGETKELREELAKEKEDHQRLSDDWHRQRNLVTDRDRVIGEYWREIEKVKREKKDILDTLERREKDVGTWFDKAQSAQDHAKILEGDVKSLTAENQDYYCANQDLTKHAEHQQRMIDKLVEEKQNLVSQRDETVEENEELAQRNKNQCDFLKEMREEKIRMEKEYQALLTSWKEACKNCMRLSLENDEMRVQIDQLAGKLRNAQNRVHELESGDELAKLYDRIHNLEASELDKVRQIQQLQCEKQSAVDRMVIAEDRLEDARCSMASWLDKTEGGS